MAVACYSVGQLLSIATVVWLTSVLVVNGMTCKPNICEFFIHVASFFIFFGIVLSSSALRWEISRTMLEIRNLHATIEGREILNGIDLIVRPGEVHAIMGPNGSGKSTLANVIAGREGYTVTEGSVHFDGRNLLDIAPETRACKGLFLAFQYPVEIPGVANLYFLKAAVNAVRKYRGEPSVDAMDFLELVHERMNLVKMDESMLKRSVNEGFSGGEKKRNEIFQMAVLQPRFAVMDETDSGLDIDALKVVADGVNALRSPERGFLIITHYQRLLDYIVPDRVHVLFNGRIVRSGSKELALELEDQGYALYNEEPGRARRAAA